MSARRLLLIDPDENFFRILHEQISPYGFEIYRVEPNPDALGYVDELSPELVFIAVEEPDKLGYSLCNKAKKGVAREIPVILTTSSVPPSGFHSHRKLRVHADEYIDKRTMNTEELMAKIDQLIGVGDLAVDEGVFDNIDEFDMELDDAFSEEGERTRIAPPNMLMGFEFGDDASAAVNSLVGDDDPFFDHEEDPSTSAEIPDFFRDEAGATPSPRSATVQAEDAMEFGRPPTPSPIPAPMPPPLDPAYEEPRASRSSGAIARPSGLDLGLDQVAAQAPGSDPHIEQRMQALEEENRRLQEELARGAAGAGGSSISREREFLNLREVINKKERELLDLRDEMGSKERAILDGKEKIRQLDHSKTALDSKNLELEQRLLQYHERVETLEREGAQASDKARALEGALEEVQNTAQAAQAENERMASRLADLERQRVDDLAAAEQRAADDKERALSELRIQIDGRVAALSEEHQEELANAQRELARAKDNAQAALEQAKAEHETATGELRERHQGELSARDKQLEQALAGLRQELGTQHASELRSLEERDQAARAELESEHKSAIAQLESAAQKELEAAREQHAAELANLEAEAASQVDKVKADASRALDKIKADAASAVDKVKADAASQVEQVKAEAALVLEERENKLRQEFDSASETLERINAKALAEVTAERRQLEADLHAASERMEALEREVASTKESVAKHERTIEEQQQALAKRDARINSMELDIEELESQSVVLQEQMLQAYKKIKGDEATVAKAKKALAIALTLLDDNITDLELDSAVSSEEPS